MNRKDRYKPWKNYKTKKPFTVLHGSPNDRELIRSGKPDLNLSGSHIKGYEDGSFYTTNEEGLAKSYGNVTELTLDPKMRIIEAKYLPKHPPLSDGMGVTYPQTDIRKITQHQNKLAKERGFDGVIDHRIGTITKDGIIPSRDFTLRILNPDKVQGIKSF